MTDGIGRSAATGVRTTVIAQACSIGIQLLSVVILARLLVPEDYGLLAMIVAIIAVGEVLREFGLGNAAIQAPMITNQQRSNLFWLNTMLGLVGAALLWFSAQHIGSFYDEPRVVPVAQALAGVFVIGGLATQSRANLARGLRFSALNLTDVIPAFCGLIVAIIAAYGGFGVWALVLQRLCIAFMMLVMATYFDRWIPLLPRHTPGMAPLLHYGMNSVATQIVSSVARNADYILIGHRFGTVPLGLYSRAFELVVNTTNQINAPSTKVAVPILSRLQEQPQRYTEFLLRGQRILLFAIVPMLGVGATLATPLVLLALGPVWADAIPFVQVLAIAAATDKVLGYSTWWFALSTGRTDVSLKVSFATSFLLIVAMIIGSAWGPLGVAWGYAVGGLGGWLCSLVLYGRLANAPSWQLFKNALNVLLMNLLPVAGTLIAPIWLERLGPLPHLTIGLCLYLSLWVVSVTVVARFRVELRLVLDTLRRVVRR